MPLRLHLRWQQCVYTDGSVPCTTAQLHNCTLLKAVRGHGSGFHSAIWSQFTVGKRLVRMLLLWPPGCRQGQVCVIAQIHQGLFFKMFHFVEEQSAAPSSSLLKCQFVMWWNFYTLFSPLAFSFSAVWFFSVSFRVVLFFFAMNIVWKIWQPCNVHFLPMGCPWLLSFFNAVFCCWCLFNGIWNSRNIIANAHWKMSFLMN